MKLNLKHKTRIILVLSFIILFSCFSYVSLRGNYLEYKELGDNYLEIFFANIKIKYTIFAINFFIIYILMYCINNKIKKGLKDFFEKENKEMPKLLNKSISFITSIILSSIISNIFMQKLLLYISDVKFGITDPIFELDIAFYMLQKPLIEGLLLYLMVFIIATSIYRAIYYIIVFNKYFDGVDGKMLSESRLVKSSIKSFCLVLVLISVYTLVNVTNISFDKMLSIKSEVSEMQNIEIVGAGCADVIIKRWGYALLSIIIIIAARNFYKKMNKKEWQKAINSLIIIPGYLLILFVVVGAYNILFINSNILDKQKKYLEYNIAYTKKAYNIEVEETNLKNDRIISQEDIEKNQEIIDNINILNSETILKALQDTQTATGYYSFKNINLANYNISGKNTLVYVAPREASNSGKSYNGKTYEYTHGIGQILISASSVSENGNVEYIQKNLNFDDEQLGTEQQRIYFGLETDNTIATNTKNKEEFDYIDENGKEQITKYEGQAGLNLNWFDRIILGIEQKDINLAVSTEINKNSKILINRNILKRVKKVMPYLIYDENPYTVVTDDGKIVWVIDAYTVSSEYPYSQYTYIEHDGIKEKINYIRNSAKVIVDAYDGTMKFYVVDKTDPIIMAYRNIYPIIFENLEEQIPNDIKEHLIYPEYLYNIQAEKLKVYHNVKADVLYRTDDIWNFVKSTNTFLTKTSGKYIKPYYTMVNNGKNNTIGLIQIYTPTSKQNLIAYLKGTVEDGVNVLRICKFPQGSNIAGLMQLDNQIEQEELITKEIENLKTTGTKLTKDIKVIPIENSVLYVESVYQTMLNEESKVPLLKKVIVVLENKIAIGNNLKEAFKNLLSQDVTNIEVEVTDDMSGIVDAIIKANKNLEESQNHNDWELVGKDLNKIQELIKKLEEVKSEEDRKKLEEAQNEEQSEMQNDEQSEDLEDEIIENDVHNILVKNNL